MVGASELGINPHEVEEGLRRVLDVSVRYGIFVRLLTFHDLAESKFVECGPSNRRSGRASRKAK